MIAHICAHPGMSSAPQAGGTAEKWGGAFVPPTFNLLLAPLVRNIQGHRQRHCSIIEYDLLFTCHRKNVHILYRFRYIASDFLEVANFPYPTIFDPTEISAISLAIEN